MEKSKNNQHSANKEVLSAIKRLSEGADKAMQALFNRTDQRFNEVFDVVTFIKDNAVTKEEFNRDISGIDKRLTRVEATMVTKDYLDEKMMDLRGDLVVMTRKEDVKLKALVGVLHGKKVISNTDVKKIYSMEPFAQ